MTDMPVGSHGYDYVPLGKGILPGDCTTWLRVVGNVFSAVRTAFTGYPKEDAYVGWLTYSILQPLCIVFIMPALILVIFFICALMVYLYRLRAWFLPSTFPKYPDVPLKKVVQHHLLRLASTVWLIQGRLFHGVEFCDWDRVPKEGPALFAFYHGTMPMDMYYFMANYFLRIGKAPIPVVDHFVMRIPGVRLVLEMVKATPGTVEGCIRLLAKKKVLILAPGGVREALFADEGYPLLWGKRCGFAKIAIASNIPIYPVFTENIREPFRTVQLGKTFFRWLYEKTRLPLIGLYGYFPVKLRIHIGEPIYAKPEESPELFAQRVQKRISSMIYHHQILPGSIARGLLQRVPSLDAWIRRK